MPYVTVTDGVVVAMYGAPQYAGQPYLPDDDPLVMDCLGVSLAKVKQRRIRELRSAAKYRLNESLNEWDALLAIAIFRGIQSGAITNATQISRFDAVLTGILTAFGGVNTSLGFLETDQAAVTEWVVDRYKVAVAAINNASTVAQVLAVNL